MAGFKEWFSGAVSGISARLNQLTSERVVPKVQVPTEVDLGVPPRTEEQLSEWEKCAGKYKLERAQKEAKHRQIWENCGSKPTSESVKEDNSGIGEILADISGRSETIGQSSEEHMTLNLDLTSLQKKCSNARTCLKDLEQVITREKACLNDYHRQFNQLLNVKEITLKELEENQAEQEEEEQEDNGKELEGEDEKSIERKEATTDEERGRDGQASQGEEKRHSRKREQPFSGGVTVVSRDFPLHAEGAQMTGHDALLEQRKENGSGATSTGQLFNKEDGTGQSFGTWTLSSQNADLDKQVGREAGKESWNVIAFDDNCGNAIKETGQTKAPRWSGQHSVELQKSNSRLKELQDQLEGTNQAILKLEESIRKCNSKLSDWQHNRKTVENLVKECEDGMKGKKGNIRKLERAMISQEMEKSMAMLHQEHERAAQLLRLSWLVPSAAEMTYVSWDKSSTKLEWHGILHKNMLRWNTEEMKDLTGVTPEMIDSLKDIKWDDPNLPGQFVHDQEIRIDATETNCGTRAALAYRKDPSDGTISCLYVLVTVKFKVDSSDWLERTLSKVGVRSVNEKKSFLQRLHSKDDSPILQAFRQAAIEKVQEGVQEVIESVFTENGFSQ